MCRLGAVFWACVLEGRPPCTWKHKASPINSDWPLGLPNASATKRNNQAFF
jgi:hypothetical protein